MPGRWRTGTTHLQSVVVDSCWRPMVGDEAGDFHDVIDLKDGRVAVVLGDAPGYGPAAAAIAEDVRSELRRGFRGTDDVREVFARIDGRLQDESDELIATAACAVVDPAASVVHIANAGHLPLVLTHNDAVELVGGASDPPLGIETARRIESRPLPREAALFLYTDGLIERRGMPLDEAIGSLVGLCKGLAGAGAWASEFARRATAVFGQPNDDATVLSVRIRPEVTAMGGRDGTRPVRGHVVLRVYVDPRDLRSAALLAVIADLARRVEPHLDLHVDELDVTSPSTDTEDAGVLAAPTIVRAAPGPPARVIGWFRSAEDLARALQIPLPKEDR